jgi:hypothetical protein
MKICPETIIFLNPKKVSVILYEALSMFRSCRQNKFVIRAFYATLNILILITVTISQKVYAEDIVVFPLLLSLRERDKRLITLYVYGLACNF